MSATLKFAHAVFQTAQPTQMTDWYCTVLDGHVVYQDNALCFITFDNEHHRVALLTPPVPLERKSPTTTAAMHHVDVLPRPRREHGRDADRPVRRTRRLREASRKELP